MADRRDTVLKMIAFALDPSANTHEARNMAMKACEFIQKYGLLDLPPELDSVFDAVMRNTDTVRRRRRVEPDLHGDVTFTDFISRVRPRPSPPPAQKHAPAATPPQPAVAPESAEEPRLYTLMESANCKGCGQTIRARKMAMLARHDFWHPACFFKTVQT
jgi:hypothetical protein